jgi:hypothetical protein
MRTFLTNPEFGRFLQKTSYGFESSVSRSRSAALRFALTKRIPTQNSKLKTQNPNAP